MLCEGGAEVGLRADVVDGEGVGDGSTGPDHRDAVGLGASDVGARLGEEGGVVGGDDEQRVRP